MRRFQAGLKQMRFKRRPFSEKIRGKGLHPVLQYKSKQGHSDLKHNTDLVHKSQNLNKIKAELAWNTELQRQFCFAPGTGPVVCPKRTHLKM